MTEYNDDEYIRLMSQLRSAIHKLLEMEGNTEEQIRDEIDNIIEDR